MKLFSDLDRYVATRSHYAMPATDLVNVRECANVTFNSLLAMHVLRQEPDTALAIKEYAIKTLQYKNQTNLHEFLHVMHTEILREHAANQRSEFTNTELAVQLRVTQDFLQGLAEDTYDLAKQNSRLMQLETSYRVLDTETRKLRRGVRSWPDSSWDVRYNICNKLWENLHAAQGLMDIQSYLKTYICEQKWPAPGSGAHTEVSATGNKMQLINSLPKISNQDVAESASSGATSSGSVASVANPLGKVQRRPSLFGYVPESEDEDEESK